MSLTMSPIVTKTTETSFWVRGKRVHLRLSATALQLLREIAIAENTSMSSIASQLDQQRSNGETLTWMIREFILQWLLEHPMTLPRAGLGVPVARATRLLECSRGGA
jgi:predicted DNA-binding ribbon-helix-helix protein